MRSLVTWGAWGAACAGMAFGLGAAVPALEQLLPADTAIVVMAPDGARWMAACKDSGVARMWNDDAFRPFREKLVAKFVQEVLDPAEREFGLKATNVLNLLGGQFALAVTHLDRPGARSEPAGLVALVDVKSKRELLEQYLAQVRRKWAERGQKVKTTRIRDVDFTTVMIDLSESKRMADGESPPPQAGQPPAAEGKNAAAPTAKPGPRELELTLGQVDSLLMISNNAEDLEKVMARLSGSGVSCLAEQAAFEADQRELFREALLWSWVNFTPVNAAMTRMAREETAKEPQADLMTPKPDKVLAALGLSAIQTLALSIKQTGEGQWIEFALNAPEEKRKGLLKLLAFESKDCNPPPFVPADVVAFSRWRLDGQKLWTTLEGIVNEVSPGLPLFFLTQLETAARQKDPDFDFRKQFVANLGDDFMAYDILSPDPASRTNVSRPSLLLVGSPDPERLLQSVKTMLSLVTRSKPPSGPTEREFLGHKIHLVFIPLGSGFTVPVTAHGGYLVVGAWAPIIEDYLRSGESKVSPLRARPAFADAVAKLGGGQGGLLGGRDDGDKMRQALERFRQGGNNLQIVVFSVGPIPFMVNLLDGRERAGEWFDFSLLPSGDQVAKHFGLSVYAGQVTPRGLKYTVYTPAQRK